MLRGKEITVYAHNLITGEEIPVKVFDYGWKQTAKEISAQYWNICWDMIQVTKTGQ